MVHAAALLPPGHGAGAGPLQLRFRHRRPVRALKLASPQRRDRAHDLRLRIRENPVSVEAMATASNKTAALDGTMHTIDIPTPARRPR
jgi:hypothetical protein